MEWRAVWISGLISAMSAMLNWPLLSRPFKTHLLPMPSHSLGVETLPPASGQHRLAFLIHPIVRSLVKQPPSVCSTDQHSLSKAACFKISGEEFIIPSSFSGLSVKIGNFSSGVGGGKVFAAFKVILCQHCCCHSSQYCLVILLYSAFPYPSAVSCFILKSL